MNLQRTSYRCEAVSIPGFVQQLAVGYVARGYVYYVSCIIPNGKNPSAVDAKLIARYNIALSKTRRARRKALGFANVQYLRYERFFLLLSTEGHHLLQEREGQVMRDCRHIPILFSGYSISSHNGSAHVEIEQQEYLALQSYFEERAGCCSASQLEHEIHRLPFACYGPVIKQLYGLVSAVNEKRKTAGLDLLSSSCVRLKRRIYRPFDRSVRDEKWSEKVPVIRRTA